MTDQYTESKFGICVGTIVLVTALLFIGKIPPVVYENIVTWCISAYVVGNVVANGNFSFGSREPGQQKDAVLRWNGKPNKEQEDGKDKNG